MIYQASWFNRRRWNVAGPDCVEPKQLRHYLVSKPKPVTKQQTGHHHQRGCRREHLCNPLPTRHSSFKLQAPAPTPVSQSMFHIPTQDAYASTCLLSTAMCLRFDYYFPTSISEARILDSTECHRLLLLNPICHHHFMTPSSSLGAPLTLSDLNSSKTALKCQVLNQSGQHS